MLGVIWWELTLPPTFNANVVSTRDRCSREVIQPPQLDLIVHSTSAEGSLLQKRSVRVGSGLIWMPKVCVSWLGDCAG